MTGFLNNLDTRYIGKGKSQLLKDFIYEYEHTKCILVPEGFITDFASIPRIFRFIITGSDNTKPAAVIHDYLYSRSGSRKERKMADKIFLMAMAEENPPEMRVPRWKRRLAYAGVRAGGWVFWYRYRKKR